MKAWRLNAHKVNELRALEMYLEGKTETPTARVQKNLRMAMPKAPLASTWLLDGLLVRGGFVNRELALPGDAYVPLTQGSAKYVSKLAARAKRWLGL